VRDTEGLSEPVAACPGRAVAAHASYKRGDECYRSTMSFTQIHDGPHVTSAKRRIERQLAGPREDLERPMFGADDIRVEMADRVQAIDGCTC